MDDLRGGRRTAAVPDPADRDPADPQEAEKKAEKNKEVDELLAAAGFPQAAATAEGADVMALQTEKSMELRKEVRQFASDNPELAAQLIRGWMRGGDDNE